MENYRSMSCKETRNNNIYDNININNNNISNNNNNNNRPKNMQELRSYSTSYATHMQVHPQPCNNNNNTSSHYNKKSKGSRSTSSTKGWMSSLSDPEIQRKKRVVSYKVYAVEGKMKGSFRKSFRWIKSTCSHVVHGLW